MNIRVISDGTSAGTMVFDESGDRVKGITALRIRISMQEPVARVTLDFANIPITFTGEAKVRNEQKH